ncbi:MAG: hypothetical protein K8T25_04585 [Planctomycetia bacterium]|nr:hypothetical protein [Planctomycetia bacterium]
MSAISVQSWHRKVWLLIAVSVLLAGVSTWAYLSHDAKLKELQSRVSRISIELDNCTDIQLDSNTFRPQIDLNDPEFAPLLAKLRSLLKQEPSYDRCNAFCRLNLMSTNDPPHLYVDVGEDSVQICGVTFHESSDDLASLNKLWESAQRRIEHDIYNYPSGEKKAWGYWRNGKRDGEWVFFRKDGTELRKEIYREGRLIAPSDGKAAQ